MITHYTADAAEQQSIEQTRWRIDPSRSRLAVRGRLEAAGDSIPLELDARLRRVGDELEIDATTEADHEQLGMTWSKLGLIPTPSELTVHGRLVR